MRRKTKYGRVRKTSISLLGDSLGMDIYVEKEMRGLRKTEFKIITETFEFFSETFQINILC